MNIPWDDKTPRLNEIFSFQKEKGADRVEKSATYSSLLEVITTCRSVFLKGSPVPFYYLMQLTQITVSHAFPKKSGFIVVMPELEEQVQITS